MLQMQHHKSNNYIRCTNCIKTYDSIYTGSSLSIFGTETTIGDTSTQDDMFIRFSDQEDINTYTPTATNTAGTQRLADGSKIRGAIRGRDAIYVWTDTALFTQRFVGQPFTFGFAQVGTNCGLRTECMC